MIPVSSTEPWNRQGHRTRAHAGTRLGAAALSVTRKQMQILCTRALVQSRPRRTPQSENQKGGMKLSKQTQQTHREQSTTNQSSRPEPAAEHRLRPTGTRAERQHVCRAGFTRRPHRNMHSEGQSTVRSTDAHDGCVHGAEPQRGHSLGLGSLMRDPGMLPRMQHETPARKT